MNKSTLLTILGSAALGLASKRKGAGSLSSGRTMTCSGVPWDTRVPLWHGTTAYRKIMDQNRIKTRQQLVSDQISTAVGGGTDKAVSMTADYRVAVAVVVGLNVFRKIANREISAMDMCELAHKRILPKLDRSDENSIKEFNSKFNPRVAELYDSDFIRLTRYSDYEIKDLSPIQQLESFLGGYKVNNYVIPEDPSKVFDGVSSRVYIHPDLFEDKPEWVQYREEQYLEYMTNLYKNLLSMGNLTKTFYDPLFFGTQAGDFIGLDIEDIGIVCTTSSIPRICFSSIWGYYDFGYLDENTVRQWGASLDELGWITTDSVEGSQYNNCFALNWGRETYIGNYKWVDTDIKPTPQNTMIGMGAMSEVRVYDPSKLTIHTEANSGNSNMNWGIFRNRFSSELKSISEIPGKWADEMIAYPYFADSDRDVLGCYLLGRQK
jgi:hypothetical protein